ncbi:MAG TPA: hypothetical protein DCS93_30015 [Microscillaceae bacterium]|nr:hypothetical protein [Microscillaceae bacterium]
MKSFLTSLLFCGLFAFQAIGQTKSTLQIKLNGYLNFSDRVADQTKSMIQCLAKYQRKVNRYKRYKSRLSRIYPPRCNYSIDYVYKKAQEGHLASLNSQVVTVKNIYEKIRQRNTALRDYCTRKTYLTDNYKFSDNTIKRLQQLFEELQSANEKLKQAVAQRGRTALGANELYSEQIAKMRQILAIEDNFQKKYFINLNDGRYVNPTEQQLAANVQKLSKLVATLPLLESNKVENFSLSRYYGSFKRSAKRLLDSRRKSWDKSLMDNTVYIYRSNTNYAYNTLVRDFNYFVKACKAKRIYFLKHSRVSPTFVLKKATSSYSKNPVVVVKTFTDKPTPALSVTSQSRPISQTTLAALNSYIHCLNETIDRNNALLRSIKAYHRRLQRIEAYRVDSSNTVGQGRRRRVYYPFYFTRSYYYPRSLFLMAEQKSKQLPQNYQMALNAQLQNIQNILEEIASLGSQLNAYLRKKSYKQDRFARSKQILERYQYLYKVFDTKRNRLYADILKIKASYAATNDVPVSDSEKEIAKALKLGLPVMDAANKFMRKESKDILAKSTATPLVEAFGSTQNIRYSREKRAEWRALRRIKTFVSAVSSITNAVGKYRVSPYTIKNLAYNYNYLVESYNDIAVSQGKHQRLMKMQYPQILTFGKVGYIPCDCGDANDDVDMTSMKGFAHNNLMLLLDVSGSMKDELPMLKKAMKYLVKIMRPEDHVSVVVFESRARVMLRPTSARYQDKILRAIDTLKSRGSTNGDAGIRMAYQVLQENYINQGNNRVIMVTDGEFTIKSSTFDLISNKAQQDISMSVFSFADQLRAYNKLRRVVEMGKGNYEVVSEGNAAYKMVREAQSKKLPGRKRRTRTKKNTKKPCDCNSSTVTKIEPPKIITTTKDSNGVNMTSMRGFAPNNLMLLLDVSGSMASKNKLPLLKTAFKKLIDIMRPEDEVSIVVYAGDASVVLKPTSASKPDLIKEIIDKLRARGKTDVKKGFKLAYKWITKNYKEEGNNRIILATDGEFPLSDYIYKLVRKRAEKGVRLSVFSFGNKNKFDSLQKLVEKGQGNYEHVDENNVQYKLVKEAQSTKVK